MTIDQQPVYFISDSTAITIEKLGRSLLSQFPAIEFRTVSLRYVNTIDRAQQASEEIQAAASEGKLPIIFSSIVNDDVRAIIKQAGGIFLDIFDSFLGQLETVLEQVAGVQVGQAHGLANESTYTRRIEAMNFSLRCDDGLADSDYPQADVILFGVSRCGKTPTCLYLAMQYGIFAANYPLTEDDALLTTLPTVLAPYRDKLIGLTIQPSRLQQIRSQRRASKHYASIEQCQREVRLAETLFKNAGIPVLDSSQMSIEEIATHILLQIKAGRQ